MANRGIKEKTPYPPSNSYLELLLSIALCGELNRDTILSLTDKDETSVGRLLTKAEEEKDIQKHILDITAPSAQRTLYRITEKGLSTLKKGAEKPTGSVPLLKEYVAGIEEKPLVYPLRKDKDRSFRDARSRSITYCFLKAGVNAFPREEEPKEGTITLEKLAAKTAKNVKGDICYYTPSRAIKNILKIAPDEFEIRLSRTDGIAETRNKNLYAVYEATEDLSPSNRSAESDQKLLTEYCSHFKTGRVVKISSIILCRDADQIKALMEKKGKDPDDYLGKYYKAVYLVEKTQRGISALESICDVSPETFETIYVELLGSTSKFAITDSKDFPLKKDETYYALKPVLEMNFLRRLAADKDKIGVICFERDIDVYKAIAPNAELCIMEIVDGRIRLKEFIK